jgi:hypothetical protein
MPTRCATVIALVLTIAGALALGSPAGAARAPRLRITVGPASQDGQRFTVSARVNLSLPGDRAQLQERTGRPWTVVAQARIVHRRFTLRWTAPAVSSSTVFVRIRLVHRSRVIATTPATPLLIPRPPVLCAPPSPSPPYLPPGDGWVTGGSYNVGGPAPGIDQCTGDDTVTAVSVSTGAVAATQAVAAGQSYTLVLPAGTYTLSNSECSYQKQTATVTAGKQTEVNTPFDVP